MLMSLQQVIVGALKMFMRCFTVPSSASSVSSLSIFDFTTATLSFMTRLRFGLENAGPDCSGYHSGVYSLIWHAIQQTLEIHRIDLFVYVIGLLINIKTIFGLHGLFLLESSPQNRFVLIIIDLDLIVIILFFIVLPWIHILFIILILLFLVLPHILLFITPAQLMPV